MKNLLLILLLANILYWMWGMFTEEDPQPGVVVMDASELGAPLNVSTESDSDSVASVGGALGSGQLSALQAVVGRSCVTLGPFIKGADADSAILEYTNQGMRTALRLSTEETFVGHWVQIRGVANAAEANDMVTMLHDGGLNDAYKVVTEDEGIKISLGLFGDIDGAEKIELEARSLGLPAEISPRMAVRAVSYVDIGLPPGKGAGDIVEKYGEDKVKMRQSATCPK